MDHDHPQKDKVRKVLLLVGRDGINFIVYVCNLLRNHEVPGTRFKCTRDEGPDFAHAPAISQRHRSYTSFGVEPAQKGLKNLRALSMVV
jgi:hypothetical protein